MRRFTQHFLLAATTALFVTGAPTPARAHCDRVEGPVVKDAQRALTAGKVTAVLKWITPKQEPAIKDAFNKALAARQNASRRQAADTAFFTTLVKLHRQSEGAPFTGLKPAGGKVHPAIAAADRALDSGSVETLRSHLLAALSKNVDARYRKTHQLAAKADRSVALGRKYVKAYVDYVHYIKRLHTALAGGASHH